MAKVCFRRDGLIFDIVAPSYIVYEKQIEKWLDLTGSQLEPRRSVGIIWTHQNSHHGGTGGSEMVQNAKNRAFLAMVPKWLISVDLGWV